MDGGEVPDHDSPSVPAAAAVHESFAAALRSLRLVERDYAVAGHRVRLRFAGAGLLERLTPALAHLEAAPEDAPALTVNLWDSVSSGSPPPPGPPTAPVAGHPQGATYYYSNTEVCLLYEPLPRALSILDGALGRGWYWVADAGQVPFWDAAAPIRHILHWWLGARGCQVLHGGGVGKPSGGVVIVGAGGSGKSTTALSSLRSQLSYAGDDYVAVTLHPEPWLHSLYCSGKLEDHHAERFPHLVAGLSAAEGKRQKRVIYVHQVSPERTTAGFPLRAVLIPRVTGRSTPAVVPAPRAAALAALAPSTIFQLHPPRPEAFSTMARLVAAVPSFFLELGSDVEAIPEVISRLLSDGSA